MGELHEALRAIPRDPALMLHMDERATILAAADALQATQRDLDAAREALTAADIMETQYRGLWRQWLSVQGLVPGTECMSADLYRDTRAIIEEREKSQ